MRIDLFLKKTQIIKRRTISKEIIEKGHTFINGKLAKPSSNVKNEDILDLHLGRKIIKVKAFIEIKKEKEYPTYEILETIIKEKENA